MRVRNAITAAQLKLELNGESLAHERLRRTTHRYEFLWYEFALEDVLPRHGKNVLRVTLEATPENFVGTLIVDQVEVLVEYSHPRSFYERPELL